MADTAVPWVDLPREVTANILQRLSVEDIFQSAQVCTVWWRLLQDPSMWRYVDLWNLEAEPGKVRDWDKICRVVVNRSEGQLISIKLSHFATDRLLFYIAQRAKQLRHLGIRSRDVSDRGFSKAVKGFPLLEELQLKYTAISIRGIEAAGRSCPFLNSFSFIKNLSGDESSDDGEAVAIAENMHGLKHLTLDGNEMLEKGLEAILDACPLLQSLNLHHCDYLRLEGELWKRCSLQIKDLNYTDDYPAYLQNPYLYISDDFDEMVCEPIDWIDMVCEPSLHIMRPLNIRD
ncbi:PREDICTED: putative F-box/LRR-repeat protein 23 [Ipomoea nil]|uniref:putative F-box/LRR-repeat protein 23 n=1 Tax=Ipomoea nil TaxID=35883 RepID=UPI000901B77E|nr:PREDICTED: putative F-box/LRR-repeat protein 23 [Ipomoea nil]